MVKKEGEEENGRRRRKEGRRKGERIGLKQGALVHYLRRKIDARARHAYAWNEGKERDARAPPTRMRG